MPRKPSPKPARSPLEHLSAARPDIAHLIDQALEPIVAVVIAPEKTPGAALLARLRACDPKTFRKYMKMVAAYVQASEKVQAHYPGMTRPRRSP